MKQMLLILIASVALTLTASAGVLKSATWTAKHAASVVAYPVEHPKKTGKAVRHGTAVVAKKTAAGAIYGLEVLGKAAN